jgi:hypothetical protein
MILVEDNYYVIKFLFGFFSYIPQAPLHLIQKAERKPAFKPTNTPGPLPDNHPK